MITKDKLIEANTNLESIPQKGKKYVMVNTRVKAFRDIEPDGSIETQLVSCVDGMCIVKAVISDSDGKILSTGYAYEKEGSSFVNKTSYIENCETSAVGRALGFLGIGIDDSMASADEVANAMTQQKELEVISEREQKTFVDYCERLGQDFKDIGKKVGAKSLKTMTKKQHAEALQILMELENA